MKKTQLQHSHATVSLRMLSLNTYLMTCSFRNLESVMSIFKNVAVQQIDSERAGAGPSEPDQPPHGLLRRSEADPGGHGRDHSEAGHHCQTAFHPDVCGQEGMFCCTGPAQSSQQEHLAGQYR